MPGQLDPHVFGDLSERRLARLLFASLVAPAGGTGVTLTHRRLAPERWRFTLDSAAHLAPRERVSPEAIEWNVRRVSKLARIARPRTTVASVPTGVDVVDPVMVDLLFDPADAVVAEMLETLYLAPPTYFDTTDPVTAARQPRGAGPYQLETWSSTRLILRHVATAGPTADFPRLRWLGEPASGERVNRILEGAADVALDLGIQDLYRAAAGGLTVIETADAGNVHGLFDRRLPALADPRVRQALNFAVNRDRLLQQQYEGRANPLAGICNGPWENRVLTPYRYEPTQARSLLQAAGLRIDDGTVYHDESPFLLPIMTTREYEPAALSLKQDFDQIGIGSTVTLVSPAALAAARQGAATFGVIIEYLGGSATGVGELRWLDPRYRRDVAPAAMAPAPAFLLAMDELAHADDDLRARVSDLQAVVHAEAEWLFLFRIPRYTAHRPDITGLEVALTGEIRPDRARRSS